MDTQTREPRDHGFLIGLLAGTCVGAGLAMWMAPRLAAEARERVTGSAKKLGERASQAVGDLTRKGQRVRDDVAGAVARGAHEVERQALAARSADATERGQVRTP
jgi:gas vesicle protein